MTAKKKLKKRDRYIQEIITPAGNHIFRVQIRMNGQRFSENVRIDKYPTPTHARARACQIRDEAIAKMKAGYTVSNFPTVKEVYEKTFEVLEAVKIKTRAKHDIFYRQGIKQYEALTIDKVTAAHIQTSINEYARTHTKRQTAGLLAIWRRLYKACTMMNINILDRSQAVTIPLCQPGNPRRKDITPGELETFLNALLSYCDQSESGKYRAQSIYYAIRIMQHCGLRPAETFALTRADIDMVRGQININKAIRSTEDKKAEIGAPKNDNSIRSVPIPEALKPYLLEWLQLSKHDLLFADYFGRAQSIDDIDTLILNVRKKHCPQISFTLYQLRHQFSTDMNNSGIALNITRDIMGHSSQSMTLAYAISNEKDRKQAINERVFS